MNNHLTTEEVLPDIIEGDIVASLDSCEYEFTGLPIITVDGTDALIKIPNKKSTVWIAFRHLTRMNNR